VARKPAPKQRSHHKGGGGPSFGGGGKAAPGGASGHQGAGQPAGTPGGRHHPAPRRHGGSPPPGGGKKGGKPAPPAHHAAPKHHAKPKTPKKPAKAAGLRAGSLPLFGNDVAEVCAPAAAASSLLLSSGLQVSAAAVNELYYRAGGRGESGVFLEDLAAELEGTGLAGIRAAVTELHPGEPYTAGMILDLGGHAAVFWAGAVLMWGAPEPAPGGVPGLVVCWDR
jgi:hypothetical protein